MTTTKTGWHEEERGVFLRYRNEHGDVIWQTCARVIHDQETGARMLGHFEAFAEHHGLGKGPVARFRHWIEERVGTLRPLSPAEEAA